MLGFLKKIGIVLCSLLCACLALELALRLLSSEQHAKHLLTDRPRKYFGADSAHPKQDYDYSEERAKDSWRALVLGDSFTFGPELQFDDTFPKRLERFLNLNKQSAKAEVMNVGMAGYSTIQESRILPDLLSRYKPDFVLLQITLNDLEPIPYQDSHRKLKTLIEKLRKLRARVGFSRLLSFVVERLINTLSHREFIQYYQDSFSNPKLAEDFKKSLARMQKHCQLQKVGFAAVLFPLFELPLDRSYPFHTHHKLIKDQAQQLNIPLLDLFERFRGLDPYRLQLAPGRDLHPNEIAHRIAAEEILHWMREEKFVPAQFLPRRSSRKRSGKVLSKF